MVGVQITTARTVLAALIGALGPRQTLRPGGQ
jgi:hypothetical protein